MLRPQDASEYAELPVRHNEDKMNTTLAKKLPLSVSPPDSYDSPHSKAHLLLQAHFSHSILPIADYQTDTKSVLDQALRILQVRALRLYYFRVARMFRGLKTFADWIM